MKYEQFSSTDRIRIMADATRECDADVGSMATHHPRIYSCSHSGCMVYTQADARQLFNGVCPFVDRAIARLKPH